MLSKDVCSGVRLVFLPRSPTTNLWEPRHEASSVLKKCLEMNIEVLSSLGLNVLVTVL